MSISRSLRHSPLIEGIVVIMVVLTVPAQAPYSVSYDQKWSTDLCIGNYDIGAQVFEEYSRSEHIESQTQISTRSFGLGGCPPVLPEDNGTGLLEARLRSQVIGEAEVGWMSADPIPDARGRHTLIGRSIERLTGVFSVDEFLQLWPNATAGDVSIDWLPCA